MTSTSPQPIQSNLAAKKDAPHHLKQGVTLQPGDKVLEVQGLTKKFGGLTAIEGVDLTVRHGEIVALIGPNGAGKTTFFNCVTGMYVPTSGRILTHPETGHKRSLQGRAPHTITRLGLARTFQNIRLFHNMTVLENVMMGQHCRMHSGILGSILRFRNQREEEDRVAHFSYELLKEVGLQHKINLLARNLAYAEQRRLEIARALATEPFLLLLDEPAAGMNPKETQELDELITRIRTEQNKSILLIEHDMRLVMKISDRIYVMDYGRKIAEGTPNQIKDDPKVIKAYLGEDIDI